MCWWVRELTRAAASAAPWWCSRRRRRGRLRGQQRARPLTAASGRSTVDSASASTTRSSTSGGGSVGSTSVHPARFSAAVRFRFRGHGRRRVGRTSSRASQAASSGRSCSPSGTARDPSAASGLRGLRPDGFIVRLPFVEPPPSRRKGTDRVTEPGQCKQIYLAPRMPRIMEPAPQLPRH